MGRRIENDSLGPVEVDEERYWGAQTERSRRNFTAGERMPLAVVRALGLLKKHAAEANRELAGLPERTASLVVTAAEEVAVGALDDEFPLVVLQTGSGTQTNMNVNEVVAGRANELAGAGRGGKKPVHPNDDVNRSQSSNDAFPTAVHVALVREVGARLLPALAGLRATLAAQAIAWGDVVKLGRTHLMDALPIRLGQEVSGWVAQLDAAADGVERALPGLFELAIGGTAVGTGFGAPEGFGERVAELLAEATGEPFVAARSRFAALAGADAIVALHGAPRGLAVALTKIADDVRWLASGPRGGIGELVLPANEPGSSIMPGKVNPTQAEALLMVAMDVVGGDVTIGLAAGSGRFELNVARLLLAARALRSVDLLADAIASFDARCVAGIEPDRARTAAHVEASRMLVTALAPTIGYDAAARVVHEADARGTSLREAAIAMGVVTGQRFDELCRPERMTRPGRG